MADNVYNLKFTLSNGDVIDAGQITAPQGPKGDKGDSADIPYSSSTPLMDGVGSVGSANTVARGDHRHPSDTSRQEKLVSGTNIKTINGQSVLGSGDISISGGGGSAYANTSEIVDDAITLTSTSTLDDLCTQILENKTKVCRVTTANATTYSRLKILIGGDVYPNGPPENNHYEYQFKVISTDIVYCMYNANGDYCHYCLIVRNSTNGVVNSWARTTWQSPSAYANTPEIVDDAITLTSTSTLDDLVTQILAQKTKVVRIPWSNNLARLLGTPPELTGPPISEYSVYFKVVYAGDNNLISATLIYNQFVSVCAEMYIGYCTLESGDSTDKTEWRTLHNYYPVGSIYTTTSDNVSPALTFGGTWEQIKDVFLLAAGDTYTAGSTGGSADAQQANVTVSPLKTTTDGVDGTGKNMPPYLAVYMWERIA